MNSPLSPAVLSRRTLLKGLAAAGVAGFLPRHLARIFHTRPDFAHFSYRGRENGGAEFRFAPSFGEHEVQHVGGRQIRRFSLYVTTAPPGSASSAPVFCQGASPLSVGRRQLHQPRVAQPEQVRPWIGAAELKIHAAHTDGYPRGHF